MKAAGDPFVPLAQAAEAPAAPEFEALASRPMHSAPAAATPVAAAPMGLVPHPVVGRLEGFDLLDQPVVSGVPACPGEKLVARSTVTLRRAQIGQPVVLLFEQGDPRMPLIMGVVGGAVAAEPSATAPAVTAVLADGERQVIEAEREIVLRCGDASITLTRAGKVIIQGRYVLSRSSGINKIKGAAVDIN